MVAIAAVTLVALALLWWIALAPALRTRWAAAPAEHAQLDAQLQQMATLQNRAKALQSQPRLNARRRDARSRNIRARRPGQRQRPTHDRWRRRRRRRHRHAAFGAPPNDALAQWLGQARGNAHAVPREAHLTRAVAATLTPPTGPAQAAARDKTPEPPQIRWEGTLVMTLPAAR